MSRENLNKEMRETGPKLKVTQMGVDGAPGRGEAGGKGPTL